MKSQKQKEIENLLINATFDEENEMLLCDAIAKKANLKKSEVIIMPDNTLHICNVIFNIEFSSHDEWLLKHKTTIIEKAFKI